MRTRYLLATLFTAAQLCAQSTPDLRFGGHTLGETANVFFAIAKTSASKSMTLDYCKLLLNDPRTREKIQAAHESMSQQGFSVVDKQDFSILDVDNCKQVMAAIKGENANVGARLALELVKAVRFLQPGSWWPSSFFRTHHIPKSSRTWKDASDSRGRNIQCNARLGHP